MSKSQISGAFCLLACLQISSALAQSTAPSPGQAAVPPQPEQPKSADAGRDCAPLPVVKTGSWVVIDRKGMKRRETVTAVSDERISLRLESLSGFYADNGEANFTREWAAFSGPSATNQNVTLSFSPAMNVLKFPMCPGGSHEQKLRWEGQQFSGYFTLKSKVAAKEKLAIGGKEFEVFRVEYDTGSQGGVIWYSPELGRPLKGSTRLTEWIVVEYGGS